MSDTNKIYLDEDLAVEYYLKGFDALPKDTMAALEVSYTNIKYKNDFVRGLLSRKLQIFGADADKSNDCLLFVSNLPKKDWMRVVASVAKTSNRNVEARVIPVKK